MHADIVKAAMKPSDFERLRKLLTAFGPSTDAMTPSTQVDDDHVADFVIATFWDRPEHLTSDAKKSLGIPDPPAGWSRALAYYSALAHHQRLDATGSTFTGVLPLVRVALPASGDPGAFIARTPMGDVLRDDHLIFTVDGFANKSGVAVQRVELVTPPRVNTSRFAAISLLLGYARASDTAPSCYALEAGLAQGGPRMTYFAPDFSAPITRRCDYRPTIFAAEEHYYVGQLTMQGNDPQRLEVAVWTATPHAAGSSQYLSVTINFQRAVVPFDNDPPRIYREAVARFAAIARAKKISIPGVPDFVRDLLAKDGLTTLAWEHAPLP